MRRKLFSFRGGIHPPENKELTKDKAIVDAPLPKIVCLYMSQHIGAPAKPIVEKGDKVKVGQLIGEAQGFISSPVHSSVSGIVTEVGFRPHPATGKRTQAVVVKRDGQEELSKGVDIAQDIKEISREEIVKIVKGAGIVGLGGAAFPTFVKLLPPKDKPINTLIINGAECEPYLTCDYRIMAENTYGLISGIRMIMKALGLKKSLLGIENNKDDVVDKLEVCGNGDIEIKILETKYPQGAEHQLVKAITGREFKPSELPSEAGCVIVNVATAYAVYRAVKRNIPLIERIITITGNGVEHPGNYVVRIGTPIRELLNWTGLKEGVNKIILGGPMMGIAVKSIDDIYTIKGTGGITVLTDAEIFEPQACIRCGKCVQICPYGLNPSLLGILCEAGKLDEAVENNLLECKECGSCSFVCNASRDNVNRFKAAKFELARRRAREKAKKETDKKKNFK